MPTGPAAVRGDVWLADLNPVRPHERAGRHPVLVVSMNPFNQSRAELVAVIPITSTIRNIPFHVIVQPPEGGLATHSATLCEAVRPISNDRLIARWGSVQPRTMAEIEDRLRMLMGLKSTS